MSWLLIAGLVTWSLASGYFPSLLPGASGTTLFAMALLAMLAFFGSLLLHEAAHALVARRYGITVRSITLFLFGGVAELGAEPADPRVEMRIAIAGPLASAALGILAFAMHRAAVAFDLPPSFMAILGYLMIANAILSAFNMLPAFPLDGGRILRAALWQRSGQLGAATRQAERVSRFVAYGLISIALAQLWSGSGLLGLWPGFIALFILATARSESFQMDIAQALKGRTANEIMHRNPVSASPDITLRALVDEIMLPQAISYVPVVEAGRIIGEIDLSMVRGIDRDNWPAIRVNDIFKPLEADDTIAPSTGALDLFERMMREDRRKFPVVDGDRLIGLVTLRDLVARIQLAAALASPSS